MDKDKIIRVPMVTARTSMSISTISRMEKRGEFPKRRRLGVKIIGWLESEIAEWISQQEQVLSQKLESEIEQEKEQVDCNDNSQEGILVRYEVIS
jgi:prophage regulatory protein